MCLAIPGKLIEISGKKAKADFGGIRKEIDLTFMEDAKAGDYVLVHVGFAIQKINEKDAKETYKLFSQI